MYGNSSVMRVEVNFDIVNFGVHDFVFFSWGVWTFEKV